MPTIRETFDDQLKDLQKDLLEMGNVVEEMLHKSIEALANRDVELADKVMAMDDIVDKYNLDIEIRCLELIALQQPMAKDLRTIAAIMKIITDVERMGDYTVDVALQVKALADRPLFKPLIDLPKMFDIVKKMLRESLESFVSRDLGLIEKMVEDDDEVDHLYHLIHDELLEYIERDPKLTKRAISILMIARYLERIADHITNIGERVYYMETGELKELHI